MIYSASIQPGVLRAAGARVNRRAEVGALEQPGVRRNGVAGLDPTNGFAADARQAIAEAISEMKRDQIADTTVFKENLRIHLKRFVQKEIRTKPVIVTTIVEV